MEYFRTAEQNGKNSLNIAHTAPDLGIYDFDMVDFVSKNNLLNCWNFEFWIFENLKIESFEILEFYIFRFLDF